MTYQALKSPMGVNLALISYFDTEIIYADIFKWGGGYSLYSGSGTINLDSEGWLTSLSSGQVVQAGVMVGANGYYPTGTYKATWEGTGTIIWYQDVASYSSTGSHSADVVINTTTTEGIRYRITSCDPLDPIRKIALFLPGTTPNTPVVTINPATACQFNPDLLDTLANYAVVRGMNVFRTNDWPAFTGDILTPPFIPYPSEVWADRLNKPSRAMIGIPGTERMPYEDFIELCNQLQAHPWVNIPASADTSWQTEFANMVLANLDPTLRVYVEYSNEVWNFQFQAAHRNYREGQARTPAVGTAEVSAEYARATVLLFKSILGNDRVTGLFAWQSVGLPGLIAALDHNIALYGSHGFDAGATALYYLEDIPTAQLSHYNSQTQADAIDELYATMNSHAYTVDGMSVPDTTAIYQQWKDTLDDYDIGVLLGYENGNSMRNLEDGGDTQMNATLDAFSRDPRIKQLTIDYLDSFRNASGEINCYFDDCSLYSKFGRWGSREQLGLARVDTPLFDGIQTWIEDNSMELLGDVIEERAHGGSIARLQVETPGNFGTGPRTRQWQRKYITGAWADVTGDLDHRSTGLALTGVYVWRTVLTDLLGDVAYSNEVTLTMLSAEVTPPTTGLIAYWKLNTGLTIATGVSAWVDTIGGKVLAQATGSKQPLLQTDNSLLFDGTDDYLQVALPALPSTATFALVGKQITWSASDTLVDAGTQDQSFMMTQHIISPRIDVWSSGGTTPSLWTDDWTLDRENILIAEWNGASSTMRVSDGAVTVCTAGSPGTPAGSGLTIGAEYNAAGTPNHFSNIQLKDILLYSGVLSAPDMATLVTYGLLGDVTEPAGTLPPPISTDRILKSQVCL